MDRLQVDGVAVNVNHECKSNRKMVLLSQLPHDNATHRRADIVAGKILRQLVFVGEFRQIFCVEWTRRIGTTKIVDRGQVEFGKRCEVDGR